MSSNLTNNYENYPTHPITNLKHQLLQEYEDRGLDEVFQGQVIDTPEGETYLIKTRYKIDFSLKSCNQIKESIKKDLKLIPGIGEITESRLKNEGYTNLDKLQEHPRLGWKARLFLEKLENEEYDPILNLVKKRYPASHQRVLECAGFREYENFIFVDIETLGLNHQPVILMGEATLCQDEIEVRQYLLRDLKEEPAVLSGIYSHLNDDSAFVSFNGLSFDLPYIKNRLRYFQLESDLERPHFDLYHYSRRFWRSSIPNCKLTTIEKYLLGIERRDDIPGRYIPDYYKTYKEEDNIGPLVPIIEHNQMDIVTLAHILCRMHNEI